MFLWTSSISSLWVFSAFLWRDIKICVLQLSLFSLFWSVIYDIKSQKLCVYFNILHIFTCLESIYKNSALSDDLACSKRIFAYFCIHMFYDCSFDTLNTDVFYNLNHRTAWFLCWSHDISFHQLAYSSSQRWLCILSAKCISSVHYSLWVLRAYQGWIGLVSASSSDLTQPLFSFINISLFNIIFLSTSHSTRVTNTFSSSLAQPLNIT